MLYLQIIQSWDKLKKHVDDEVRIQTDHYKSEKWSEVTGMQLNKGKKSKVPT